MKENECPKCNYFRKKHSNVEKCAKCGIGKTRKVSKKHDNQNYVYYGKKAKERKKELKFYVEEHMTKISPKKKSLDVGCGNGILPKIMEEKGWDAYGIDPFITEKFEMFSENLKSVSLQKLKTKKKFQLVTVIHALEHMPDPKRCVTKIKNMLEKRGYIFICVPNFDSYWSKLRGQNWKWLNTSEHYYHFTPNSIKKILSEAGYKNVKVTTENRRMPGPVLENLRALGYLKSESLMSAILHKSGSVMDSILRGVVDDYLDRCRKGAELIAMARRY